MSAEEAQHIQEATPAAEMDEEIPTLEAAEVPQTGKQSKRYAKRMAKMGLKPEPNITKVNIRKTGSLAFAIPQPEVYRFPGTNTFVIFGEAQLEDMGMMAQEAAARATVNAAAAAAAANGTEAGAAASGAEAGAAAATASKVQEIAEEDETEVDAGDLAEKEINVVMSQANVSRAKAIKALKNNNGDIVNAIMELTM